MVKYNDIIAAKFVEAHNSFLDVLDEINDQHREDVPIFLWVRVFDTLRIPIRDFLHTTQVDSVLKKLSDYNF
jgi:hypothetical protein